MTRANAFTPECLLDVSEGFREDSEVALDNADWRRLGAYVTRRRDELGMTQTDVQATGGPSTATQRLIESAGRVAYRSAILASLERALRWESGSVEQILVGGEPTPTERAPEPAKPDIDALTDELRRIANNPNRSAALRAMAQAHLDQLVAIRKINEAEARALGELAS